MSEAIPPASPSNVAASVRPARRRNMARRRDGRLEGREGPRPQPRPALRLDGLRRRARYNGRIFKSRESIPTRLRRSAQIMDFKSLDLAATRRSQATRRRQERLRDCYVRPVAWRGSEMMAVSARNSTIHTAIAVWTGKSMFDIETKMQGIRMEIAEYRRPDPATIPRMAKASGLYMICTISKHRAEQRRGWPMR